METLLTIVLIAAFSGLVVSILAMYKLVFGESN